MHHPAATADEAFALDQRVKASIRKGREALWELAAALYDFDHAEGWKGLGYESLAHWLADPEVGMRKTAYYRLVRCWRELHVKRQVEVSALRQLDPSKVELVLPAVKDGRVDVDDALDQASQLGYRDLRVEFSGAPDIPGAGNPAPAPVEPPPIPGVETPAAPDHLDTAEPADVEEPEEQLSLEPRPECRTTAAKLRASIDAYLATYEPGRSREREIAAADLVDAANDHLKECDPV